LVIDPKAQLKVRMSQDGYVVELGPSLTLDLVALPGGDFMMGSDTTRGDEKPLHRVLVSPFNIGRTEVTQAQWEAVMGGLPDVGFRGADRPVESVSVDDAVKFCERLTLLTGVHFRLPTEAEWEYAARGGTTTEYSFGDSERQLGQYAWYASNSDDQTHPVGEKLANPFGLFDMHGNVWEWCQDVWHENYQGAPTDGSAWLSEGDSSRRVLRGGSWIGYGDYCRSAFRLNLRPSDRYYYIGFRVVVAAPQEQPGKPDPAELIRAAKTIHIRSKTTFFREKLLEDELLKQPDFQSLGLMIVGDIKKADLVVDVTLPFLTWNFTYAVTHQASNTQLAKGRVRELTAGAASPRLAKDMVARLQALRTSTTTK
jgi:formylglycine-generating enzyme required for sulfatase activity